MICHLSLKCNIVDVDDVDDAFFCILIIITAVLFGGFSIEKRSGRFLTGDKS